MESGSEGSESKMLVLEELEAQQAEEQNYNETLQQEDIIKTLDDALMNGDSKKVGSDAFQRFGTNETKSTKADNDNALDIRGNDNKALELEGDPYVSRIVHNVGEELRLDSRREFMIAQESAKKAAEMFATIPHTMKQSDRLPDKNPAKQDNKAPKLNRNLSSNNKHQLQSAKEAASQMISNPSMNMNIRNTQHDKHNVQDQSSPKSIKQSTQAHNGNNNVSNQNHLDNDQNQNMFEHQYYKSLQHDPMLLHNQQNQDAMNASRYTFQDVPLMKDSENQSNNLHHARYASPGNMYADYVPPHMITGNGMNSNKRKENGRDDNQYPVHMNMNMGIPMEHYEGQSGMYLPPNHQMPHPHHQYGTPMHMPNMNIIHPNMMHQIPQNSNGSYQMHNGHGMPPHYIFTSQPTIVPGNSEESSLHLNRLHMNNLAKRAKLSTASEADDGDSAMGTTASPSNNYGSPSRWTEEQDQALKDAVEKFDGRNWKAIAELVPGRDHVQCLQRWKKVLRPGLVKGHWTPEEDQLLLQLIQDEKMHSWAMVASKIHGRTAKQCRERWSLNLDPGINRAPWTPEEDTLLLNLFGKLGGKWSEIKTQFDGRTENAVKTRFKSLQRAKAREWTQEQDRLLISLRIEHGKNWAAIQKEMPGRSRNAIKVRCKTLEYDNGSPNENGMDNSSQMALLDHHSQVLGMPTNHLSSDPESAFGDDETDDMEMPLNPERDEQNTNLDRGIVNDQSQMLIGPEESSNIVGI